MALLHQASISPTKLEMLAAWVPHQHWYAGDGDGDGDLAILGAYRFDDPAGEVGIETFLVRAGDGPVLQVPVTYRAAALAGAEDALVTEMQHSVLGPRWVHDGLADPVYVTALATAVLTGGRQAPLEVQVGDELREREATTFAVGSGVPGTEVPPLEALEVTVRRVLDQAPYDVTGRQTLTGRWPNNSTPTVLATVLVR